ncbi:MAG: rod shape-determining protein RodA [bacterium]
MLNLRMLRHSDILLWISVGILIFIGITMIFSCTYSQQSRDGDDPLYYTKKQLVAFVVGLFFLTGFAYFDYSHLKGASWILYGISIASLLIVLFKGFTMMGAQRWLAVGPISFQPSEMSKIILLIALASFLGERRGEIKSILSLVMPLVIVGIPFILIFQQPDLGTAIILFAIFTGMLIWAETSAILLIFMVTPLLSILLKPNIYIWMFYLAALAVYMRQIRIKWMDFTIILLGNIGIVYAVAKMWGMLKTYQKARLLVFLNPERDPLGIGYHSLQAKIAVGSGGFLGKGFMHGTQTQLAFIPQQFTDFVFSALGEEFGFLGSVIVLVLFAIVIYRAIVLAGEARDFFGSMLAAGIAAMLSFQVLVNVGMTIGLLPVVGVPLPFLSFGGTALVINMCAIGILQSIAMRRHKLLF